MTRIIGGIAGSRVLASPAKVTRPTSDRIRESIFSRLDALNLIENAKVLDLFAGTGALGLESASRLAMSVVLVESHRQALGGIIQNIKMLKTALNKEGLDCDIKAEGTPALNFVNKTGQSFDLVFIDPPYDIGNEEISVLLEALIAKLDNSSTVILERSSRDEVPEIPEGLTLDETKTYGDTVIYWLSN